MPIFEYQCPKCGAEFEEIVNSTEKKIKCLKCGSEKVEKRLSTFAPKSGSSDKSSCPMSHSCCGAANHSCGSGNCCGH